MRKKIAVFATGYAANILTQFMRGLKKGFEPYLVDTHLFLAFPTYLDTPEYAKGELNIFNLPDMKNYDGAVLFANTIDQPGVAAGIVKKCNEAGIPVISHGKMLEGAHNIVSDNRMGMRELTQHLIDEHGVRNICVLSGTKDSYDAVARLEAVKEIVKDNDLDLPVENIFYTDWNSKNAGKYVEGLVRSNRLPDAIICANDDIAITVCITLKELGMEVPRDVIVTGFDHIPVSETFFPSLATVDQKFEEHGIYAAQMIYDLSEGKEREEKIMLKCEFVTGESCGCSEDERVMELRRNFCVDSYVKHNRDASLNGYTLKLERCILASGTYEQMKQNVKELLTASHDFEGNTFHFFVDPKPFMSISENRKELMTFGYSSEMDVVFSVHDNVQDDITTFRTEELLPEKDNDENHMYVFAPLHDNEYSTGYLIFCDCYESMWNRVIHTYQSRIDVAIEKFRQNLYLKYLNKRVIEFSRIDPLTHVKNRAAYESRAEEIASRMHTDPDYRFAVAMFDVNNLKTVNDELGHDAGDEYLLNATHYICSFFKHSPVYRIGGDEFVAILEDEDFENRGELIIAFRSKLDMIWETENRPVKRVSIASGVRSYDPNVHGSFEDVCKESDIEMYENKKAVKAKYQLGSAR